MPAYQSIDRCDSCKPVGFLDKKDRRVKLACNIILYNIILVRVLGWDAELVYKSKPCRGPNSSYKCLQKSVCIEIQIWTTLASRGLAGHLVDEHNCCGPGTMRTSSCTDLRLLVQFGERPMFRICYILATRWYSLAIVHESSGRCTCIQTKIKEALTGYDHVSIKNQQ